MSMAIMRFSMQKSARRLEKNVQMIPCQHDELDITTQVLEDYRRTLAECAVPCKQ